MKKSEIQPVKFLTVTAESDNIQHRQIFEHSPKDERRVLRLLKLFYDIQKHNEKHSQNYINERDSVKRHHTVQFNRFNYLKVNIIHEQS